MLFKKIKVRIPSRHREESKIKVYTGEVIHIEDFVFRKLFKNAEELKWYLLKNNEISVLAVVSPRKGEVAIIQ